LSAHVGDQVHRGVLLAVSGGPDSRALLEAVARWAGRFLGTVCVASVEHGTRAAAEAEAHAVVSRAHVLGFSATVLRVRPQRHDEASLRDARFAALEAHAHRLSLASVVLAHHQGDVVEGRLLGFFGQGGGVLRPVVRRGRVTLLHPFLGLTKPDLALALAALSVRDLFVDDETRSARARLRQQVLPVLPDAALFQARLAADAALRADDEETLMPLATGLVKHEAGGLVVQPGPRALVRRAIEHALRHLATTPDLRASAPAIGRVVALFSSKKVGIIHLAGGVEARIAPDAIRLRPR
jgi:tRNA(Ile)-lysidine synthase